MKRGFWKGMAVIFAGLVSTATFAEEIFLGFDTQTAVQRYTTGGAFVANFGQGGATGSALDGAGHAWTVAPAFGNNQIERYDSAGNVLNTFTAAIGGQWIEDMAYGGFVGGVETLWIGTFEGTVLRIDALTGAIISTIAGNFGSFVGVANDGTNLWITGGGPGGAGIVRQIDTSGNVLSSFDTGFTGAGGIGYSMETGTLWVGYFGDVRQFNTTGTLLSSFTAGTAFHDGLEIGNLVAQKVPEPATVLMIGGGLLSLVLVRRRRV